ncbi:hypothetical protein [Sediminibacillus massiliensis]|uniref:hypothetical protein n=1 Tax=Sediminibacillus massiliensis TaxID=1926277 RepID=UPI00098851AF|nr:hypothetical protein [Sediminibacillus massiliensis]
MNVSRSLFGLLTILFVCSYSISPSIKAIQTRKVIETEVLDRERIDDYVGRLEEYLILKEDGTVSFNEEIEFVSDVPPVFVSAIEQWMAAINKEVKAGTLEIDENYEISSKEQINQNSAELITPTETKAGKSSLSLYWWGYKMYLDDALTKETRNALLGGVVLSRLVDIWIPWFSVPTAALRAVAASVTLVAGSAAAALHKQNNGKGVYIRFTGMVPFSVVVTGIFPQ